MSDVGKPTTPFRPGGGGSAVKPGSAYDAKAAALRGADSRDKDKGKNRF